MTDRPTAATITDAQLADLYADLDHYEEHVVGDLNEKNISLARRAGLAEAALTSIRDYADRIDGKGGSSGARTATRAIAFRLRQLTGGARPATPAAPSIGPCPACRRADQAGLAPAELHNDCAKEQR